MTAFGRSLRVAWLCALFATVVACGFAQESRSTKSAAIDDDVGRSDPTQAGSVPEPAAEHGDHRAPTLSGLLCVHRRADTCAPAEAIRLLSPGAEAGNRDAQYGLALALLRADTPRTEEARRWLERAADGGHVVALFELGQADVAGGERQRGAARLRRAAELGFAPAQVSVAGLYETGTGVRQSSREALRWYHAAAEQDHPVAQVELGRLYELGEGAPVDSTAAERWYRISAEGGYSEGQYRLGLMYMTGEIVQPQYFEGIYWLEQAAEAGHARAQDALGRAYLEGLGVRQSPEDAIEWFRKAAEQGLPVAQHNLAAVHEGNFYVRDYSAAASWYERAAKAGYEHSMISLGDLYRLGRGVRQSLSQAQGWYARAANSSNPDIAKRARQRMQSTIADSAGVGIAMFGAGNRFPTPAEVFDAIIAAGIAERVLFPNAARPADPGLDAAYNEAQRQNQLRQQRLHDDTMQALQASP